MVDWLRGVAVVFMIMAHGMDAWLFPAAKTGDVYAAIRVGSGIPARLFLFLVGVSAAIQFESGLAKGLDTSALRGRFSLSGAALLIGILILAMLGVSLAKTRYSRPAVDWLRARFRSTRLA